MACSPRSSGASSEPPGIESPDHRFQGITKPGCFVSCELNDESAAAFKRDTHDDAAPLLGDLERTVTCPRLHRRHSPIPFLRTPPHDPPGRGTRRSSMSAVKPASHNRFYLSPYYPVFGSRMVMIRDPCGHQGVLKGLFCGRSAFSPARRLDQVAVTPARRLDQVAVTPARRLDQPPVTPAARLDQPPVTPAARLNSCLAAGTSLPSSSSSRPMKPSSNACMLA
jgi:hypothetical protein